MLDYQVQPNSRRCAITGRELKPGDKFYTVLIDDNGTMTRQEHCEEAWNGPPDNVFSYWTGRVPTSEKAEKPAFDDEMLLECFTRLEGEKESSRINFRYILSLLLMRRKQLKFDEVCTRDGQEVHRLREPRTKVIHEVIHPNLTEQEILDVQEEVYKVLGW